MTTEQRKENASQKYRRKLKENPELHAEHLQRERIHDSKRREVMIKKMDADVDLKILARIRSKERMQATRKRRWSHGKGAVDGLGGSVKRSVCIAVKSRKAIVNSPFEFYNLARSLSKNIIFKFVAKEEVKQKIAMLDNQWEGLKNIPGIQSKHFFQFGDAHNISVACTSLSQLKCTLVLKSLKPTANTDSDWDDDDLEPLMNQKVRNIIPSPDPSVSYQSKSLLPLKKRLRISDVYSDSDTDSDNECLNDETPSTSLQA